ncbi:putative pentatricopeptide repeat-containing protein At5g40405 [Ananas comosus]|uniref:Pentatricopeptide repeat-containing protein At5g40405 n=1 Tax=Ananas comosus TaxID=4615 RepID=A0A6P5H0L0_ANACO|nr:putative pentatricopeptide repeat-containing protein At5g40405 [Ananas comosus]
MKSTNIAVSSRQISNSKPLLSSSNLHHFKQLHAKLLRTGEIEETLTLGKLVADVATSHPSNLRYAHSLFSRTPAPLRNAFMYNSMIRGSAESPDPDESVSFYKSMLRDGFRPNNYTYPFLLKACSRIPEHPHLGCSLHASVVHRGFEGKDPFIQTSLVSFYASIVDMDSARKVFDRSPKRDVTVWNALIKGYIMCSRHADAARAFRVMSVPGDEITMLSVASALANLGALEMGRWVHAYIDRNQMNMTVSLATALINMYAKCGEIESARYLFDRMPGKDVRMWSIMISGFAINGLAKEALDLFSQMKSAGFKPDSVTLTGVLSACSHAGMVQEGLRLLDRMAADYLIEPTIEHYGCVVDLLGRAGQLEEALALINRISLSADVALWGALLVACRVHKNLEMGEMVAKEMLKLDPVNAGARVFLSNVYAASGKWGLVEDVRKGMKEQMIYKPPGSSSIELDGTVHEFLSGDRSHSHSDQIYKMLDEICNIVRSRGHKSTTKEVTFDIDEEDKEACVSQHSEKLAVAFGLINTRKGAVLRIVKNLRICEDCHSVMKLVSEVFDRTIIVRDRNRFHHFNGGSCSCRDYW